MTMRLYDAPRGSPYALRLFILERGGLNLEVDVIDTIQHQHRRPAFRKLNGRGTVPALQLDNGTVVTEITAIAEYLDEMAQHGPSLIGKTAAERLETRMWLRRIDYEIVQPVIQWWRDDPASIDDFLGWRIPCPAARMTTKLQVNQALNQLEEDLEGKTWLCGDRLTAADLHCFGLLRGLVVDDGAGWVIHPARRNVLHWWRRMMARPASETALGVFANGAIPSSARNGGKQCL